LRGLGGELISNVSEEQEIGLGDLQGAIPR
jgi:hypothetical protein